MVNDRHQVWVHIGTHKTGTTYLQRWLDENDAFLRSREILYPADFRPMGDKHRRHSHRHLAAALRGERQEYPPDVSLDQLSRLVSSNGRIILSSEDLWHIATSETISKFHHLLHQANQATVVYLRHPVLHVKSMWKERLKKGLTADLPEFVQGICAELRSSSSSYYAYEARLSNWSAVSTIYAFNYDEVEKGRDLLGHFLSLLNIAKPPNDDAPLARVNQAMSDEQAALMLFINRCRISQPESVDFQRWGRLKERITRISYGAEWALQSAPTTTVSCEEFYQVFVGRNLELRSKFGIDPNSWSSRDLSVIDCASVAHFLQVGLHENISRL